MTEGREYAPASHSDAASASSAPAGSASSSPSASGATEVPLTAEQRWELDSARRVRTSFR